METAHSRRGSGSTGLARGNYGNPEIIGTVDPAEEPAESDLPADDMSSEMEPTPEPTLGQQPAPEPEPSGELGSWGLHSNSLPQQSVQRKIVRPR
jgi:hypothetical protein